MARVILVYGQPASGKTFALRNLDPETTCIIDADIEEFQKLVAPLVEYLQTKCDPHTSVIVEWDRGVLVKDICVVAF
ncbi:MAG: hypothetical protein IKE46_04660, partial [Selenomonadaceae bacterium]|nr:hypothetical protein [Selenomonadaceae bacterium]